MRRAGAGDVGGSVSASVIELRASMRAPRPRPPRINWWALLAVMAVLVGVAVLGGVP